MENMNRIIKTCKFVVDNSQHVKINSEKVDEFVDWYEKQELKCAYCDIPQDKITEYQWLMPNINIHRLTIDRIDNNKGYVKGNICLACARCNLTKSNVLSFKEAREIGQRYVKPKWKN